jgi:hypothetical protein
MMMIVVTIMMDSCGRLIEGATEIFGLNYPDKGTRLLTTPSKKSRDGLKGEWLAYGYVNQWPSGFAAGSPVVLLDDDRCESLKNWPEAFLDMLLDELSSSLPSPCKTEISWKWNIEMNDCCR